MESPGDENPAEVQSWYWSDRWTGFLCGAQPTRPIPWEPSCARFWTTSAWPASLGSTAPCVPGTPLSDGFHRWLASENQGAGSDSPPLAIEWTYIPEVRAATTLSLNIAPECYNSQLASECLRKWRGGDENLLKRVRRCSVGAVAMPPALLPWPPDRARQRIVYTVYWICKLIHRDGDLKCLGEVKEKNCSPCK